MYQVVNQQLMKLQDLADKCKTMSKSTDSQLKFFQQYHQTSKGILEAISVPLDSDDSIADTVR